MDIKGKQICIVGMGRSAVAAARLLQTRGAMPFVTEAAEGTRFAPHQRALDELGVAWECGGHTDRAFNAALVVLSPGVPPSIAPVSQARRSGIPVRSELEVASWFCTSKVLAVTGTNGKTTTTELLAAMLAAAGERVQLAGNNGVPLSEAVLLTPPPAYLVIEVSSYALETAYTFRPWVGAILNLTPDHLGRHQTMETYAAVKRRLFQNQFGGDVAVLNEDDAWAARMQPPPGVTRLGFSVEKPFENGVWLDGETIRFGDRALAARGDVGIPGNHNLANALAALCMAQAGGFDWKRILGGLRAFPGVEHRIEHVADVDGAVYYNDSKSTNVDSLRVALESFDAPIVLLAGGQGKGGGYEALRGIVGERVKRLVVFGEDAPRIAADLEGAAPCERADSMADAVSRAHAATAPGDIVLLSPGCASFDMYPNFEVRGADFKDCVRRLATRELV